METYVPTLELHHDDVADTVTTVLTTSAVVGKTVDHEIVYETYVENVDDQAETTVDKVTVDQYVVVTS